MVRTNRPVGEAFDTARWGLLGPAALLCALLLDVQWSADQSGLALPAAGPGAAGDLAATYAAGGLVASGQACFVWSEGIDDSLTLAVFLGMMLALTVILPVVAAIAFALVPGRRLRLAGRVAVQAFSPYCTSISTPPAKPAARL